MRAYVGTRVQWCNSTLAENIKWDHAGTGSSSGVRKEKERKERMLKKEAEKKLRDAARSARAINRSRASGTRRETPK